MFHKQISIAVLLVLSTLYTSESRGITISSQVRNDNDGSSDDQNCFCFENSGQQSVKVPDLIQPSYGLERLVVYLYRDLDSDQIKLYTPSLEKQKLIPDLPFGNDDGLIPVSTETINTILSNNPDKLLTQVINERPDYVSIDESESTNDNSMYINNNSDLNESKTQDDSPVTYISIDTNLNRISDIKPQEHIEVETTEPFQIKFIEYETVNQIDGQQYTDGIPSYPQINIPNVLFEPKEEDQVNDWILHESNKIDNLQNEEDEINLEKQIDEQQYPDSEPTYPEINIPQAVSFDHIANKQHKTDFIPEQTNIPNMVPYDNSIRPQQKIDDISAYSPTNMPYNMIPHIYTINEQPYFDGIAAYTQNNIPLDDGILSMLQGKEAFNDWILEQLKIINNQEHNGQDLRNQISYKQYGGIPTYQGINIPQLNFQPIQLLGWVQEQLKENNPKSGGQNIIHLSGPIDSQQFSNGISQYPEYSVPYGVPFIPQRHGQFSEWILGQLEVFDNLDSDGAEKIDLYSISNSIIQILLKNGMYITNNGMLVEANGKISDIHNLSLRAIMIGNTVPLGNLLKKHEPLSSQVAYIQAILVTTTDPLKILGLIPLGKTYLPMPIHKTVTETWQAKPQVVVNKQTFTPDIWGKIGNSVSAKTGNEVQDNSNEENSILEPNENNAEEYIPIKSKKKLTRTYKNKEDDYNTKGDKYIPYRPSNYYNTKGNGNNIAWSPSRNLEKIFSSRRGLRPGEYRISEPYSKRSNELDINSLQERENDSNVGRLFLPRLALFEEPLEISANRRSQNIPQDIVLKRYRKPATIKVPDLITNFVDVAFRSDEVPENNTFNSRIDGSKQIVESEGSPITGVIERDSNPINSVIKTLSKRNKIQGLGLRQQLNLKGRLRRPVLRSDLDENGNAPIINYYSRPQEKITFTQELNPRESKIQTLGRSLGVNAIPMSSQEGTERKLLLDGIKARQRFYQNIPNLVSPVQLDISSRSGSLPDGTISYNSPNVEPLGLLVDNGDDDDDDDGDFRIIGGNAATGSGTPLSNKGRSGYVF